MLFRNEVIENMQQIIELRLADLLSDEEFLGRIDNLIYKYRSAHGSPQNSPTSSEVQEIIPTLISLSLMTPERETKDYSFNIREITLGRSGENAVILPKNDISRRHARILFKDGHLILLDLKSENGTYLNGKRLGSPQVIHGNDIINIGDYEIIIRDIH